MELGLIIPLTPQPSLYQQPIVIEKHDTASFTNETLKAFIDTAQDSYGEAAQLLKDSEKKSRPRDAPWANVKDTIGSVAIHTDKDSTAQLHDQAELITEVLREHDGSSSPFSFHKIHDSLTNSNESSVGISPTQGCPEGSAEYFGRCLFLKPLTCVYEQLLETDWREMTDEEKAFSASACLKQ